MVTAVRELREETGYEGENARLLGRVHANPAILTNTCFTVIVENCRLKHKTQFDHSEDLVTRLVPVAEMPKLVADEKISHSLVVVALYHFDLWQRGLKTVLCSLRLNSPDQYPPRASHLPATQASR